MRFCVSSSLVVLSISVCNSLLHPTFLGHFRARKDVVKTKAVLLFSSRFRTTVAKYSTIQEQVEKINNTTDESSPYYSGMEKSSIIMGPVVDIYPYTHSISDIKSKYAKIKTIHMIRHAEGTHNVQREYRDIINLDARLTDRGRQQCADLAKEILDQSSSTSRINGDALPDGRPKSPYHHLLQNAELIVTSPLTRCVQTALFSFPTLVEPQNVDKKIPIVAVESLRETVNYNCDRRRSISEIAKEFEQFGIDFGCIQHDHDDIWASYERRLGTAEEYTTHRESAELHVVADRAREFFQWLQKREETEIIVCTHSAYLRCLWNWGQSGVVPELMPQVLDTRDDSNAGDIPVVRFCGDDDFEKMMRSNYENCELRSFIAAY